jgi:lipopolysaccharide export LptBFGC system permease protein LptF
MKEELVIDERNFDQYFFDVRKHRPKKGQVMAKFTAMAKFVAGREKRDIIMLLKMDKAYQASQVMKKIHGASEPYCYKVCREMCEDLLRMSEKEVEEKPYQFVVEYFFYTQREYVPKEDPRWELLPMIQYDKETKEYKSTITI